MSRFCGIFFFFDAMQNKPCFKNKHSFELSLQTPNCKTHHVNITFILAFDSALFLVYKNNISAWARLMELMRLYLCTEYIQCILSLSLSIAVDLRRFHITEVAFLPNML